MLATYKDEEGENFLERTGMDFKSGSWTIRKYGFRRAGILAREWVNKMNESYALWEEHGDASFRSDAEAFLGSGAYEETAEFAEMAEVETDAEVLDAIMKLQKIANETYDPSDLP